MREKPVHTFKNSKNLGLVAFDDLIHINTQSGSQWDGFRGSLPAQTWARVWV